MKIEMAEQDGVDFFHDIAIKFMSDVLDLDEGDYLISDESDLHDFTTGDAKYLSSVLNTIHELYGLDLTKSNDLYLVNIFRSIYHKNQPEQLQ